jgi:hypothetical protein
MTLPYEGFGFAKSSLVKQKDKGPSSHSLFNPAQPAADLTTDY